MKNSYRKCLKINFVTLTNTVHTHTQTFKMNINKIKFTIKIVKKSNLLPAGELNRPNMATTVGVGDCLADKADKVIALCSRCKAAYFQLENNRSSLIATDDTFSNAVSTSNLNNNLNNEVDANYDFNFTILFESKNDDYDDDDDDVNNVVFHKDLDEDKKLKKIYKFGFVTTTITTSSSSSIIRRTKKLSIKFVKKIKNKIKIILCH